MKCLSLAKFIGRIAISNMRELPLPYRLTFAVTNRCQAHCTMCGIWQKPVQDELSLAEITRLFNQANRFSWINLTGGELFQRPDISDIIQTVITESRDLHLLNFPTNGVQTELIIKTVDQIISDTSLPRLIVSVSIDGPPNLHDRIRGLSGCWEQAITTFRHLRERQSPRFSVYLGHTIQPVNLGQFDATLTACAARLPWLTINDFHFNVSHISSHYYNNIGDQQPQLDSNQAANFLDKVAVSRKNRLFDPVHHIEQQFLLHARRFLTTGRVPLTCQAASASCFINSTGSIYPCTAFDAPIGNLRDQDMDLYRLWRSNKRLEIRQEVCREACPGCWTPCEAYQTLLANLLAYGRRSPFNGGN